MKTTILRVFACVALVAAALPAMGEDAPRVVTVTGTSVTKIAPDVMVWNITSTDTNPVLLQAKQANDEKLKAVMAVVGALGVDPKDVDVSVMGDELTLRWKVNVDEAAQGTT